MLQFLYKGGLVMIPLLLCSVTGVIIIIERMIFYSSFNKEEEQDKKLFKAYVKQGNIAEAIRITEEGNSAFGRIANIALRHYEFKHDTLEDTIR